MARSPRANSSTLLFLSAALASGSVQAFAQTRVPAAIAQQPPVLTVFTINGGADSVSSSASAVALTHTVVGTTPSEYRVSHRADFSNDPWRPYSAPILVRDWYDAAGESCLPTGPSHRVTLYLQVRATVGEEVRIVDGQRQLIPARVESNVLRATICARVATRSPGDPSPTPAALLTPWRASR